MHQPPSLHALIEELRKLPGIGIKTARRLAFHLFKIPKEEALALSSAIKGVRESVRECSVCHNLTEQDPCGICCDSKRDSSTLCVVEEPGDVLALEVSGTYKGRYWVLGGAISPVDGIGPTQLRVPELVAELKKREIREVIVATNPTSQGETTAFYLSRQIKPLGIKVTRLALGLPMGSAVEHTDKVTLGKALEGRTEL